MLLVFVPSDVIAPVVTMVTVSATVVEPKQLAQHTTGSSRWIRASLSTDWLDSQWHYVTYQSINQSIK